MKKNLFLAAAFSMLFVFTTQAQLRLGVKGGININDVSLKGDHFSTGNLTGFQVGATMEWLFIENFGIDAAVLYSQKGIKIDHVSDIKIDKNVGYLDIPVNAKLKIGLSENFKPYVAAGPYISFNLSGSDISDQWKSESFSAGVNFGAGVELYKFLQIGVNYGIGLTDDYKTISGASLKDLSAKSRIWSITAAVYF
ncbi:MAG: PorT family protein [Dysgonamonadaceae bacterium]|jgi:opacity protein-like surface antigen|nr:PorT family protein [Dysgonamonadaceae bacterium]